MEHRERLEAYFKEHPPATIKPARAVIAEQTGIERSPTQVRGFLRRLGLQCRKVGQLPAKADVEQQAAFLEQELEPRLAEATAGKRQVFLMDAAHFVLSPLLGFLWSAVRIFIQAPSRRQRFHVLGALDAVTKEICTVTNQSYITSWQVCEWLTQLAWLSAGLPITVVLDNARYQRCHLVMAQAASLGSELLFLPPYSPNLNLIERVWKFVKKQCLYSKYYDQFEKFKQAIWGCLETAPVAHKDELNSLLTLNFQTFEKAHFVPV
jgi:transposase